MVRFIGHAGTPGQPETTILNRPLVLALLCFASSAAHALAPADYVRHNIEPPAATLDAWRQRKNAEALDNDTQRRDRLERVIANFAQRTVWWNTTLPRPASKAPGPVVVNGIQIVTAPRTWLPAHYTCHLPAVVPDAPGDNDPTTRPMQAHAEQPPPVSLASWTPDAPYLARLRQMDPADVYAACLGQKQEYANNSGFFLDAADILFDKGRRDLALRVLSNLAEMAHEDRALMRLLGYRLMQAGEPALAVPVLRKVLQLAGDEPLSYRDLGLALAANGETQEAVDILYQVVERPWHPRFPEIGNIVLADMNAIIAAANKPLDLRRIDPRLRANLPLDLRVVLTWDADNSDIDLRITAPDDENAKSLEDPARYGARMSHNITGGYGPEEYSLRRAAPGKYRIHASYLADGRQVLPGPTSVQVKVMSHFGTPRQKEQSVTLRMKGRGQTVLVGEFEV
ncbi:DUF2135 domain-containing protein [Massilia sp. CCM 8694]|uniref:DUF2135 domain-containing protein n=1 Tax=Massilia genomosp. 1 TaxID=2609280 RepID=A0ABX0MQU1_9BURK|nr:DUF2135 domain-containing protein [Massilia genomosp. 1]